MSIWQYSFHSRFLFSSNTGNLSRFENEVGLHPSTRPVVNSDFGLVLCDVSQLEIKAFIKRRVLAFMWCTENLLENEVYSIMRKITEVQYGYA